MRKRTEVTPGSSATYKISHDPKTKVLTVVMAFGPPKNYGETLKYANVPVEVFNDFTKAESKGQFFNYHVRNKYTLL